MGEESYWRTAFLKRTVIMEKGNRLFFIVEGDCEVAFINKMIIPYLYRYCPRFNKWVEELIGVIQSVVNVN